MLRFGPDRGPVVVAAPALFEEANRTRAFLVRVLRLLAERGIASVLPDLPGQGESTLPTEEARLRDWRVAYAAAARSVTGPSFAFAMRGGALIDGEAAVQARHHFSPQAGGALLRDLDRARRAASAEPTDLFAGNRLRPEMVDELAAAEPSAADRVIRLHTDPRPADVKLLAPPLWRRSEPGVDEPLAVALADDVAAWVRRCVA